MTSVTILAAGLLKPATIKRKRTIGYCSQLEFVYSSISCVRFLFYFHFITRKSLLILKVEFVCLHIIRFCAWDELFNIYQKPQMYIDSYARSFLQALFCHILSMKRARCFVILSGTQEYILNSCPPQYFLYGPLLELLQANKSSQGQYELHLHIYQAVDAVNALMMPKRSVFSCLPWILITSSAFTWLNIRAYMSSLPSL